MDSSVTEASCPRRPANAYLIPIPSRLSSRALDAVGWLLRTSFHAESSSSPVIDFLGACGVNPSREHINQLCDFGCLVEPPSELGRCQTLALLAANQARSTSGLAQGQASECYLFPTIACSRCGHHYQQPSPAAVSTRWEECVRSRYIVSHGVADR